MTTTFAIVPASGASPLFVLFVIPLVLVIGYGVYVVGSSLSGSKHARFEVRDTTLTLCGDVYGRTIPRHALKVDEARIVNLTHEHRLAPVRRTMGTALPGYRAGWFRLADGEKALLYVTDDSRVVYLPTTQGYALLLSPLDPEGLLSSLRAPSP
ncbi:MAG TPA: PH domain-containing protein [Polyangiaceae bacterium]|nr:PH domain-containing protein [Polyangiaceae bacterium]